MKDLSDDEILALAEAIKKRRTLTAEYASYRRGRGHMIRWDTGNPGLRSFISIDVTADEVADLIEAKAKRELDLLDARILQLRTKSGGGNG